ncbi:hypothetical protein PENTCL1PPCAC_14344, partial [Pristionchus entomophagus]
SIDAEPIFAATCAYYPDDTAPNACGCGGPTPPIEPETADKYPLATAIDPATRPHCPVGYTLRIRTLKNQKLLDYTDPSKVFIRCRAGYWIYSGPPAVTSFNSYEISEAACFRV